MEGSSGVKKGTWSEFEDDLLKACVQLHGEGNWHLVPQRAGLNRCRKSCRLRWLNYLKPNIKRGDFSEDEIDLMNKLHKLLGNRWSLIAGRLPGRTSNDVKNYWNTFTRRKILHSHKEDDNNNNVKQYEAEELSTVKPHEVIKPVPRTLSKKFGNTSEVGVSIHEEGATWSLGSGNWWENLLLDDDDENEGNNDDTCFFGGVEGAVLDLWGEELTSIASDFLTELK